MGILSQYIAKEFLRFFLLFFLGFSIMIVVGTLFGNLGDAFSSWKEFVKFLKSTAVMLPSFWELLLPMTALLATISTFSTLSRTSEVVAMRAAGMGFVALAKPLLYVAAVLALLNYANQHYLQAWLQKNWVQDEKQQALPPLWKTGEQSIFYFGERPAPDIVQKVTVFQWRNAPYHLSQRWEVERGEKQATLWKLENATYREFLPATLKISARPNDDMPAQLWPEVHFETPLVPHLQPLWTLYQQIQHLQREGQDVTPHWVEWHHKLASFFTIFVMVLIGLSLSVSHARHGKAAEGLSISFLLGVLFWIAQQIFLAVGSAGALMPVIAAWLANVIFFVIALLLMTFYRS